MAQDNIPLAKRKPSPFQRLLSTDPQIMEAVMSTPLSRYGYSMLQNRVVDVPQASKNTGLHGAYLPYGLDYTRRNGYVGSEGDDALTGLIRNESRSGNVSRKSLERDEFISIINTLKKTPAEIGETLAHEYGHAATHKIRDTLARQGLHSEVLETLGPSGILDLIRNADARILARALPVWRDELIIRGYAKKRFPDKYKKMHEKIEPGPIPHFAISAGDFANSYAKQFFPGEYKEPSLLEKIMEFFGGV